MVLARDGAEALEKARGQQFDLLLTDLVMPEREGLEIIRILRKERPDLKVVAVSGAFGGAFLKAAQLLGADATLFETGLAGAVARRGARRAHARPGQDFAGGGRGIRTPE